MEAGSISERAIGLQAAEMAGEAPTFTVRGVDGWLQGRTMYGGASSFLAYAAARKARPDLPPLRGAQISFLAPVGSDVDITVSSVREGKSVANIQTDLSSGGTLAHRETPIGFECWGDHDTAVSVPVRAGDVVVFKLVPASSTTGAQGSSSTIAGGSGAERSVSVTLGGVAPSV